MKLGQAIDRVRKNIIKTHQQREPICYHASEALYHLAGGKRKGLKAMRIAEFGAGCHWFIQAKYGEIIDLTAGQFKELPDYASAKGAAFYPTISNHAKELMKP